MEMGLSLREATGDSRKAAFTHVLHMGRMMIIYTQVHVSFQLGKNWKGMEGSPFSTKLNIQFERVS